MKDINYNEINLGDYVIVPDPDTTLDDAWNHSFEGCVVAIRSDSYIEVEDGDGDVFTIEPERVEISNN